MSKGRPSTYGVARTKRIVFYVDEGLNADLKAFAEDSGRSLSDYLYVVCKMHSDAVKAEGGD